MKHICSAMLAGMMILCMSAFPVQAADYPTKPITLINPYSAGGSHDLLGRAFASVAEKYLKNQGDVGSNAT